MLLGSFLCKRQTISEIPFLSLLQRCSSMDELKQIHALTVTLGLSRFTFIANKLLAFSALSDPTHANSLFAQITHPNLFTFNSMIMATSKTPSSEMGISLYAQMRGLAIEPSARTFAFLVKACSSLTLTSLGLVQGQVIKFGCGCDLYVVCSLINAYSKLGLMKLSRRVFDESKEKNVVCWTSLVTGYCNNCSVNEARKVFDEMPERSEVCHSAMVSGYVQNSHFHEAIELFRAFKTTRLGANPKGSLLVSVLGACASIGAFKEGKWIHSFLNRNRFEYGLEISTALVDFYAKCGLVREAREIFDRTKEKDVTTWSAMIYGLALNGENIPGLELFSEMEKIGPKPNSVTLIGVLRACNHQTLVEKAWYFFVRMTKVYEITPLIEHYGCMVDILARSGRVREAEILIRTMPMEPDGAIWGSLLNGCLIHDGHVELGQKVGSFLIELEPESSGRYVFLANMNSKMGKWREAIMVRKMMREREVARFSGWSSVEIGGLVHKFVAGDKSHPMSGCVCDVLGHLKRVLEGFSVGPTESSQQTTKIGVLF